MDISIIIVSYNNKEQVLNCIKSIEESDFRLPSLKNGEEGGFVEYEIIMVDNNSGDDIIIDVQKKFKDINFIQSNRNLGMGGGNNLGIEQSRGKYVLVLNPDTLVESDAIRKMYDYMENHEDAGIVGPKLLYPDGSLQYSCFREWKFLTPLYRRTFLGNLNKKHIDNFLMKDFDHNSAKEADWLMGSCLFIRKSVLEKIGMFDHRFFMYFEDTDLCRRVRNDGKKIVYYPEAMVIHNHGRESADKPWYLAPFFSKLSRIHISSWLKYFMKWNSTINR